MKWYDIHEKIPEPGHVILACNGNRVFIATRVLVPAFDENLVRGAYLAWDVINESWNAVEDCVDHWTEATLPPSRFSN